MTTISFQARYVVPRTVCGLYQISKVTHNHVKRRLYKKSHGPIILQVQCKVENNEKVQGRIYDEV